MVRLYIADLDAAFIRNVRLAIKQRRGIEVVGDADNGAKALCDIRRLRPDVVLTDIQLPQMDGIALLKEIRRIEKPASVIICTRFYPAACMDWCFRYGASYFLCKPIDFERLPELIVDCAAHRESPLQPCEAGDDDAELNVQALLTKLGISSRLNGSAYLVKAVTSARENALLLRNLSHGLYQELASGMNTTVSRVERSLRNAIDIGYERGSLSERFSEKPTNREFIEFLLRETE